MQKKTHLYIVGAARSGTTALAELLNQHPDACIGIERYKYAINKGLLSAAHFEKDRFFSFSSADTNVLPEKGNKWSDIYGQIEAKWDHARVIGDKVPRAFQQLELLQQALPGVKIIFCLRKIGGVASSWNRRASDPEDNWPEQNDYRKAVEQWNKALKLVLREVRTSKDFFVLPYELFYRGETFVADRLLDFLGLAWTKEFRLEYERTITKYITKISAKEEFKLPGQDEYIASHADIVRYKLLLRAGGFKRYESELATL